MSIIYKKGSGSDSKVIGHVYLNGEKFSKSIKVKKSGDPSSAYKVVWSPILPPIILPLKEGDKPVDIDLNPSTTGLTEYKFDDSDVYVSFQDTVSKDLLWRTNIDGYVLHDSSLSSDNYIFKDGVLPSKFKVNQEAEDSDFRQDFYFQSRSSDGVLSDKTRTVSLRKNYTSLGKKTVRTSLKFKDAKKDNNEVEGPEASCVPKEYFVLGGFSKDREKVNLYKSLWHNYELDASVDLPIGKDIAITDWYTRFQTSSSDIKVTDCKIKFLETDGNPINFYGKSDAGTPSGSTSWSVNNTVYNTNPIGIDASINSTSKVTYPYVGELHYTESETYILEWVKTASNTEYVSKDYDEDEYDEACALRDSLPTAAPSIQIPDPNENETCIVYKDAKVRSYVYDTYTYTEDKTVSVTRVGYSTATGSNANEALGKAYKDIPENGEPKLNERTVKGENGSYTVTIPYYYEDTDTISEDVTVNYYKYYVSAKYDTYQYQYARKYETKVYKCDSVKKSDYVAPYFDFNVPDLKATINSITYDSVTYNDSNKTMTGVHENRSTTVSSAKYSYTSLSDKIYIPYSWCLEYDSTSGNTKSDGTVSPSTLAKVNYKVRTVKTSSTTDSGAGILSKSWRFNELTTVSSSGGGTADINFSSTSLQIGNTTYTESNIPEYGYTTLPNIIFILLWGGGGGGAGGKNKNIIGLGGRTGKGGGCGGTILLALPYGSGTITYGKSGSNGAAKSSGGNGGYSKIVYTPDGCTKPITIEVGGGQGADMDGEREGSSMCVFSDGVKTSFTRGYRLLETLGSTPTDLDRYDTYSDTFVLAYSKRNGKSSFLNTSIAKVNGMGFVFETSCTEPSNTSNAGFSSAVGGASMSSHNGGSEAGYGAGGGGGGSGNTAGRAGGAGGYTIFY